MLRLVGGWGKKSVCLCMYVVCSIQGAFKGVNQALNSAAPLLFSQQLWKPINHSCMSAAKKKKTTQDADTAWISIAVNFNVPFLQKRVLEDPSVNLKKRRGKWLRSGGGFFFLLIFHFCLLPTLNTLGRLDCCLRGWYIHPVELWHYYFKGRKSAHD